MKLTTVKDAQKRLPELVIQAQQEAVGLTDDNGNLVGLLAGVSEDDLDDLLVQTQAYLNMIERSRLSLESGAAVSAKALLAEAQAELRDHAR